MLSHRNRTRSEDQKFDDNEAGTSFRNYLFVRVSAKEKTFTNVDFKYCIFDGCYLRGCRFQRCDFTGCKFLSTSFHGSTFLNCEFAYATFEKTIIADDILDSQAPNFENQRIRFARTLRTNYQQLGEAESVNKAIRIELEATGTHLYNAWRSGRDYYRAKYRGAKRFTSFLGWLWFRCLDFLWGNGERVPRLLRSLILVFVVMGLFDATYVGDPSRIESYWRGICVAPEVFVGARSVPTYPYGYLAIVAVARILFFAALTAILVKRLSRR